MSAASRDQREMITLHHRTPILFWDSKDTEAFPQALTLQARNHFKEKSRLDETYQREIVFLTNGKLFPKETV